MATQKDILEPLDEREGYNIGDFAWTLHEEGDVSNAGIVNEAIREHKQLLKNVGDLQKTLEQTEECYAKLITTEINATNRCGELQATIERVRDLAKEWEHQNIDGSSIPSMLSEELLKELNS